MPDVKRQPVRPDDRAYEDDPLVELARIVSGGQPFPDAPPRVRAEPPVAPAQPRAEFARQPMPNQLSALEQELFSELRSTVDPDRAPRARVEPVVSAPQPVSKVVPMSSSPVAADPAGRAAPSSARSNDFASHLDQVTRPSSSGVSAGSYDPAFDDFFEEPPTILISPQAQSRPAQPTPVAPPRAEAAPTYGAAVQAVQDADRRDPRASYPEPTFQDFGREEIAAAAREAQPFPAAHAVAPEPPPVARPAVQRTPSEQKRGLMIAAAALGVFVMGGLGFLGWRAFGPTGADGAPPLILADAKPMKVKPEGQPTAPTGPSLAVDKVEDKSRLFTKQEEPVDQVAGRSADGRSVRVIPGAPSANTPEQPRTVRTVVVRPDGTILQGGEPPRAVLTTPIRSNEPTSVGTAPSPTVTAALPPVPGPTPVPPKAADPIGALAQPTPPRPAAAAPTVEAPAAARPVPPATAATQPASPSTSQAAPARPVPPPVRPLASQPLPPATGAPLPLGPVAPTRLASTNPAAPAPVTPAPPAPIAAAPAPASGGGQFVVQLAAAGSDADARRVIADGQRKYSALGGRPGDVQVFGSYHRARVVFGSKEEADQACAQIKSQGGDCLVRRR